MAAHGRRTEMKKKAKSGSKKQGKSKTRASAKAKSGARSGAKARARGGAKKASSKRAAPKRRSRERAVPQGSQSVETVPMSRALRARAGAGGGDFGGVSTVESVENESADELLEEGQAFEAGIVSGVENAPDADQGPIRTREVP